MKQITAFQVQQFRAQSADRVLPGIAPQCPQERILSDLKAWDCPLNILATLKR